MISHSSVDAKYQAMVHTSCELMWIRNLMNEMGVGVKIIMTMYYNNQGAIYIANNPMFHKWTKYIEVDCHLIR